MQLTATIVDKWKAELSLCELSSRNCTLNSNRLNERTLVSDGTDRPTLNGNRLVSFRLLFVILIK
jgi:hypothetical protein